MPLILKNIVQPTTFLIQMEPVLEYLYPGQKAAQLLSNKLLRPGRLAVPRVLLCNMIDKDFVTIKVRTPPLADLKKYTTAYTKTNPGETDSDYVDKRFQCLNLPADFTLKKNRSRVGLNFLEEQFWDEIKTGEEWSTSPLKEKALIVDRYFNQIKNSNGVSSPVRSLNQNRHLLSDRSQKIWKQGDWLFDDHFGGKDLGSFEARTNFDHKIDQWVKINIPSSFLGLLNNNEQYIESNVELGLKSFGLNVLSKLAQGAGDLFHSHLTVGAKNTYYGFRAEPESRSTARSRKVDYSLNLVHNSIKKKLPLLSVEEKTDSTKLNLPDTVAQITRYCHALLNQEPNNLRIAAEYKSVYCILVGQKMKHIRLVKFNKMKESIQYLQELVEYSKLTSLKDRQQMELDVEQMHLFFRILLKLVYLQLESLNLFIE